MTRLSKYRIFNYFFLVKFLNKSTLNGKKLSFFKMFFKYYSFHIFNKIFKQDDFFFKRKRRLSKSFNKQVKNALSFINNNLDGYKLNYLLGSFFKKEDYVFGFFIEKQMVFINQKKKSLDKLSFFIFRERSDVFFFRFFKLNYLGRVRYKSRIRHMIYGDFYNETDPTSKEIIKNITMELLEKTLSK